MSVVGKWLRLGAGALLLYGFWGYACPWLLSWSYFADHEKLVREKRIPVGAIFYTELENYPGKPAP